MDVACMLELEVGSGRWIGVVVVREVDGCGSH
jgi:hypothetical protein